MEELNIDEPPPQYTLCMCACHKNNKSLELYKELYAVYFFYLFCLSLSIFFDEDFVLVKITSVFVLNAVLGYMLYWI